MGKFKILKKSSKMILKTGQCIIICGGTHFYPDNWKMGDEPTKVKNSEIGILLQVDKQRKNDTRTFWKVFSRLGTGWINSKFCILTHEEKRNHWSSNHETEASAESTV